MYAIKHIMQFYGSSNRTIVVRDVDTDKPMVFKTRRAAKRHIAELEGHTYHLRHNQYGYDHRVVDITKPRNAAWFELQCRGY